MARQTGNNAWRALRPPLRHLDDATADDLWAALNEAGFPG